LAEIKKGSLWIPDCFGVRRQSGAAELDLSDGGYQQRSPGTWTPASTRAAATALSPDRKALVWDR